VQAQNSTAQWRGAGVRSAVSAHQPERLSIDRARSCLEAAVEALDRWHGRQTAATRTYVRNGHKVIRCNDELTRELHRVRAASIHEIREDCTTGGRPSPARGGRWSPTSRSPGSRPGYGSRLDRPSDVSARTSRSRTVGCPRDRVTGHPRP
jgi:hypothetical protein